MSSRDAILAAVRAHLPHLDRPEPPVPLFDADPPADLLAAFGRTLETMGGTFLQPGAPDPLAPVRDKLRTAGVVCSNVPEVTGNRALAPDTRPADLADVDYGVVRAAFAVAETGSVCLTERELGVNTLGYLPQHLIVLLDPADIVPNIHHAYRRPEWREARYAVFQTGPSATADIEGVLVHGAQGVRSLSVLPLARASPRPPKAPSGHPQPCLERTRHDPHCRSAPRRPSRSVRVCAPRHGRIPGAGKRHHVPERRRHPRAGQPAQRRRDNAHGSGTVRAGAIAVVLSAMAAAMAPAHAQAPRKGPEGDGKNHQPTQSGVVGRETQAGVRPSPAQEQQDNRTVEQLDRKLLHDEAVDPPRNSDPNSTVNPSGK